MSYYKKGLFVAALCASIGWNSANAVKFENLNNAHKESVLSICGSQEAFRKELGKIIKYLEKLAQEVKTKETVAGDAKLLHVIMAMQLASIAESVDLFNRDASCLTNQIAVFLLQNKKTSKEQKETGGQLASSIKEIVTQLNKSLNLDEFSGWVANNSWEKFEKLAQEMSKIINKPKQGIIGFKGTQDDWANVLFGKKKKIHQKIENSSKITSEESEEFIKLENNNDQFENDDNLSITIEDTNSENEINFNGEISTNNEEINLQLGILNSLSSEKKDDKIKKKFEDEEDNDEIKKVLEISRKDAENKQKMKQEMKQIEDSELRKATKLSLEEQNEKQKEEDEFNLVLKLSAMNLKDENLKKDKKNKQSDQSLNFNGNILSNPNLNNNTILRKKQAIHQATIKEFLSAQNIPAEWAEGALELSDDTRNILSLGHLNGIIGNIKNMTDEEAYRKGYSLIKKALLKDKK